MQLERETFLWVLKGPRLSVLMALWIFGVLDQNGLKRRTGYDKNTIRDALVFLEDARLVVRPSYRKWALANDFFQLPFASAARLAESGNSPLSGAENGDSPFSSLVVSSSDPINYKKLPPTNQQPADAEIFQACTGCGIFGEKRETISRLPHVIAAGADYVRDHVTAVKREGGKPGLAIHRIEHGWPVPPSPAVDECPVCGPEGYWSKKEQRCFRCDGMVKR